MAVRTRGVETSTASECRTETTSSYGFWLSSTPISATAPWPTDTSVETFAVVEVRCAKAASFQNGMTGSCGRRRRSFFFVRAVRVLATRSQARVAGNRGWPPPATSRPRPPRFGAYHRRNGNLNTIDRREITAGFWKDGGGFRAAAEAAKLNDEMMGGEKNAGHGQ